MKKIMLFAGLCLVLLAFSVNPVHAGNATGINVQTGGYQPNDQRTEFNLGEYVYIGWIASAGGVPATVDVSVIDPNGDPATLYKVSTERATPDAITPSQQVWANQGDGDKWLICFKADLPGSYEVDCAGATVKGHIRVGVGYIDVLPESILGTLMALGAALTAFGVFKAVKHKRAKATSP